MSAATCGIMDWFPSCGLSLIRRQIERTSSNSSDVDIGRHFLFNPMDGQGSGPWYPVNQEKIIKLIYHHVLMTGETSFLAETAGGKTVLDWVLHHATLLDVPGPVQLADYGENKSHLELRKQYGYSHIVPDLNGQRCNNFHMAATLSEMAGIASA